MERDERYLVVVNPVGRGGHAQRQAIWLLQKFRRMGIEHEALFTEKAGHAKDLVSRWAHPVDVVVAVGGDGTVNEVINGIMGSRDSNRTLAVFPSGTADDFARNMKIPRDRDEALKTLLAANERTIDLMEVNDRYAGVTVGIGLDAEIAYRSYGSKHLRLMAYWYHGLSMLFKPIPRSPLAITIGGNRMENDYLLAITGNASSYGRYMRMLPKAKMDDGVLDLATFDIMNRWKVLLLFGMSMMGKHTWAKQMNEYSAPEMQIECLGDVYAQFDGEVVIFPEGEVLRMKVKPHALRVKASEVV
ncbi:MAG: YegS/Rv2252/BmrU family lipid kinase [Actinobacteria bacterium]|nr:YegS/Rv2252/BmrU family lipid kinase [Actinomycetota bacterium]MBU1944627.1 YegS/Rv2252/BmrU family lipid kinase [Actinomycetota bacterium]MBU2689179.1 YegS/Rv2252/BmrU family lipid kinase [Actinomycetota bacterium]